MFDQLDTLITYNPTSVRSTASLAEVESLLKRDHIRHMPVTDDERQVIGIVSYLDAEKARAEGDFHRFTAGDIMVSPVFTVDHGDHPSAALQLLVEHAIHSVPVVEDGRLKGMITSTDFLREFSYGATLSFSERVSKWMHPRDLQVEFDLSPAEALRQMQALGAEYVGVVRGGCPVGIVAQRDLRIVVSEGTPESEQPPLMNLVNAEVPTVRPAQKVGDAVVQMLEHRSPAVAVVDRSHQMAGLITQDDVLRSLAESTEMAAS